MTTIERRPAVLVRFSKARILRYSFSGAMLASMIVALCGPALAMSEQVLLNFNTSDGQFPNSGLIMDAGGNLYGTAEEGGSYGGGGSGDLGGTIFKLTPTGEESSLWNFGGVLSNFQLDGQQPTAGLIMDKSGNLFGTTLIGGLYDGGTVVELNAAGQESVLWNFGSGADGLGPFASLTMDTSGDLFGTTLHGGAYNTSSGGSGTVFELTSAGQESVLWSFGSSSTDGVTPSSSLIMDASSNLYGITNGGGTFNSGGTLFKLTAPVAGAASVTTESKTQNNWTETVLWNFGSGADGVNPDSVIMDAHGNLFGTTVFGGANNAGVVFEVTAVGQESVLWNFGAGTDGKYPGGVIMDSSGDLYGTTSEGGTISNCSNTVQGCGTVFKLSPPPAPGGNWSETILWNFGGVSDGYRPSSPLLIDATGNLFGATAEGGNSSWGTVFEISNLNSANGQIALSAQHIQFPKTSVGGSSSYQLAIRNTGTGQLTGTIETPPAPFGLQGSGSFNLAPHTQTKITLTFKPAAADRAHQRATITSTSVKQNSIQLDLRGIGTAPASPSLALK